MKVTKGDALHALMRLEDLCWRKDKCEATAESIEYAYKAIKEYIEQD